MVKRATFLSAMQRIGRKKWRIHAEPAEAVVWLKTDLLGLKWEWAKYLLFKSKSLKTPLGKILNGVFFEQKLTINFINRPLVDLLTKAPTLLFQPFNNWLFY